MKNLAKLLVSFILLSCQTNSPQGQSNANLGSPQGLNPPTIQIATPLLYYQSKNIVQLGDSNNAWQVDTTQITGGEFFPGSGSHLIEVKPHSRRVALETTFQHKELDLDTVISREYTVIAPPKPEIEIRSNGRPINAARGLRTVELRSFEAVAIAQEDFARLYPEDSRYRVAEWKITLASGPRPKAAPIVRRNSNVSLFSLRSLARPGDRLVIEVLNVDRLNFRNEIETVRVNYPPLSIPIN